MTEQCSRIFHYRWRRLMAITRSRGDHLDIQVELFIHSTDSVFIYFNQYRIVYYLLMELGCSAGTIHDCRSDLFAASWPVALSRRGKWQHLAACISGTKSEWSIGIHPVSEYTRSRPQSPSRLSESRISITAKMKKINDVTLSPIFFASGWSWGQ